MRGRGLGAALVLGVLIGAANAAAPAAADSLKAGAGRADVTPPTGYYFMGWVRSDSKSQGQHTRLFARALELQRGGRKVVLVATDLGAIPNGMVVGAINLVRDRGIRQEDVIVSASHTHGAQAGYFNYPGFNTVAPTQTTPTDFVIGPADPQLYSFMVRQLATAIRRADDDLAPAAAAWGSTQLLGVTQNRSIEAHLADHGIVKRFGEGSAAMDSDGYAHTIDPNVDVLRVDKIRGTRSVPIGMWSTFANHGTVNKPTFLYYNGDHISTAARAVEAYIRRTRRVPRTQEVVNAYGNSDEGDQTAGIANIGPAAAEHVGRQEARAMLKAWREAGRHLSRTPVLDTRWTRVCFCGQQTAAGPIADRAVEGAPFFTGSEENRGPGYDLTGVPFEGDHLPASAGPQGDKIPTFVDAVGAFPKATPISAVRIADELIVTVPGEMTVEGGRRLRAAVLKAAGPAGISRVFISGLANEFMHYFTTPEEYDQQHYEGGSTIYGRAETVFITERLADLAARLATHEPAPAAYPSDPVNGVRHDAPAFGTGAPTGTPTEEPNTTARLDHAMFSWQGGPTGLDRPLDGVFVTVQRKTKRGWRATADDLGLQILWSVDDDGNYRATWEVPRDAPHGDYRFRITANRYTITSAPFAVIPTNSLELHTAEQGPGRATLTLDYPRANPATDLTYRPAHARTLTIRGRPNSIRTIAANIVKDRWGNTNRNAVRVKL